MSHPDIEIPMGNTELRLTLASIEDKLEEVKIIATDTKAQALKTNGRVSKLEKWQSYVLGFVAALSFLIISVLLPVVEAYISAGKL